MNDNESFWLFFLTVTIWTAQWVTTEWYRCFKPSDQCAKFLFVSGADFEFSLCSLTDCLRLYDVGDLTFEPLLDFWILVFRSSTNLTLF